MQLYNTLTHKKEEFVSQQDKQVKMYNCGPTVYDYAHIGNLRAFIFADTLRRALEHFGYSVTQVMNVTDFGHLQSDADSGEDKMTVALLREGKPLTLESMHALALFYTDAFRKDLQTLNIQTPSILPFASEHIEDDIVLIQKLADQNLTYITSDGVYFDTSAIDDYGKLGGLAPITESEARVNENSEKKNPRDFALWKFNKKLGWQSPWGPGFPGWHIECSGMSMKYLGETLDIHTGGIDHISIHHNNEIAQSEHATGKPFAHYWMHNEFLMVDGVKMSKSKNNFYTLRDIETMVSDPMAFKFLMLQGHYRTQQNFTKESLKAAEVGLRRLVERLAKLPSGGEINEEYTKRFNEAVADDLNTPQSIAIAYELLDNEEISSMSKRATIEYFDEVWGLGLKAKADAITQAVIDVPSEVINLVHQREIARSKKDWAESDRLRDEVAKLGYEVKDTEEGQGVKRLKG